jgi:dephospho-CoA kinase
MTSKPVIALVGGVASGKSAVSKAFERRGALVIDADVEGHEVLRDPEVKAEVVKEFGQEVLGDDGEIDRRKLGNQVFAAPKKLATLNSITHPRIRARTNAKIEAGLSNTGVKAIVLDVSLLLESGAYEGRYNLLVYVDASESVRKQRAKARNWAEGELERRQARQMNLDEKRSRADVIIDNSGTLENLERQVTDIWQSCVKERA